MALDHTLIMSPLELWWRSVNTLAQRFHALPFTSFLFLHSYILHLSFVLMPPIFAFYASSTTFFHHSFDLLHTFFFLWGIWIPLFTRHCTIFRISMALQSFLFLCFAGQTGLHCGIDTGYFGGQKTEGCTFGQLFSFCGFFFFDILCETVY